MMDEDRGNQGTGIVPYHGKIRLLGSRPEAPAVSGGTCVNKIYKGKSFQGQKDGSVCKVFVVQD